MDNELAVGCIKQYRAYALQIVKLRNDIKFLTGQSAPRNNLTARFDDNKGGYIPPARPDAMKILTMINNKQQRIAELEESLRHTERILALLPEEERLILIMKYVDRWHVNAIAEYYGYASRQSVYSLLSKSVTNFSQFMSDAY